jgi:hypothetical protein
MRPVYVSVQAGLVFLFLLGFSHGMVEVRGGEGPAHHRVSRDPSVGYAVPLQHVYQFPASLVFQPAAPNGYAVPLQHVYQFPASLVFQPGAELRLGGVWPSTYVQHAGPAFIPR